MARVFARHLLFKGPNGYANRLRGLEGFECAANAARVILWQVRKNAKPFFEKDLATHKPFLTSRVLAPDPLKGNFGSFEFYAFHKGTNEAEKSTNEGRP